MRWSTYKTVEADPVRVHLMTRGALDPEGVEVRVLFSISGLKGSDSIQAVSSAYLGIFDMV